MVAVHAGSATVSASAAAIVRVPRPARAFFTRVLLARRAPARQARARLASRLRAPSGARPVADRPRVAVHELRVRVEADAADTQGTDVVEDLLRRHAADAEVDRVSLHVL